MKKLLILLFPICLFGCSNTPTDNSQINPIKIEFKIVEDDSQKDKLIFGKKVLLSEKDIVNARLTVSKVTQKDIDFLKQINPNAEPKPTISIDLKFTPKGKKKLFEVTKKYVKRRLAIFIDDRFVVAPQIYEPIKYGALVLVANFSMEEAKAIVDKINKKK